MPRMLRISVPVSPDIQRDIRALCAANGRSAAANLADLVAAGLQKNDLDNRFSELKTALQTSTSTPQNHAEIATKLQKILADFLSEMRKNDTQSARGEGVVLPEKAAAVLFEEALFSAKLSTELVTGSLPGTPQKPIGQHIAVARQKAQAALAEIIKLCQE